MALINKLTAIADAIRSKTGGTEPLTLDGMVTAIDGISAGGGDEASVLDSLIDGSITEITVHLKLPVSFFIVKTHFCTIMLWKLHFSERHDIIYMEKNFIKYSGLNYPFKYKL